MTAINDLLQRCLHQIIQLINTPSSVKRLVLFPVELAKDISLFQEYRYMQLICNKRNIKFYNVAIYWKIHLICYQNYDYNISISHSNNLYTFQSYYTNIEAERRQAKILYRIFNFFKLRIYLFIFLHVFSFSVHAFIFL